jgi:hypothetical protein
MAPGTPNAGTPGGEIHALGNLMCAVVIAIVAAARWWEMRGL